MTRASEKRYRAADAAQIVGVSPATLRAWRARYVRGASPRAGYSESELQRLRLVRGLLELGHPRADLGDATSATLAQALAALPAPTPEGPPLRTVRSLRAELVRAVTRLDLTRAERLLTAAAIDLEPRAFVFELVAPAVRHLVSQAHATSRAVAMLLRSTAQSLRRVSASRRGTLVVATAPGERSETEALLGVTLGLMCGWDTLYLGPKVPWRELAAAARRANARLVAVWLDSPVGVDPLPELERLRGAVQPATVIAVGRRAVRYRGGRGAVRSVEELEPHLGPPSILD